MAIIHVVLFKLKASLSAEGIDQVCNDMVGLKDKCISPSTKQPYIVKSSGGKDNSPEGAQHGFTHAFVVEFANKEDRDYYVFDDPAHQAFKDSLVGKYEDGCVMDYEIGVHR